MRHGERSAAARVGLDGLAVGEEDNRQEPDDRHAERYDVSPSQLADGPQNGQGSFRPIGGRTQGIEAEDGDSRRDGDSLPPLFAGRKRVANENVQEGHGLSVYRGGVNGLNSIS